MTEQKKYHLTHEQQRVIDTLNGYEQSYISESLRNGHFIVLNGDPTERVFTSTLKALIKKGYLEEWGVRRYRVK